MDDKDLLAQRFEDSRSHLRAVAYRMLGSINEADDAVQEAWLRLNRSDASAVDNLAGWLTTVVSRVCLDMLRSRKSRREESLEVFVPEPVVGPPEQTGPEHQAELADSVGIALLVVLETLAPAERLAFVLHDMFAVPFEEIAEIVDRSPAATRQLASRARRRVQGRSPSPDPDIAEQRKVVDAFLAAARGGDFEGLLAVLDPDVVLRADQGPGRPGMSRIIRGAEQVASGAKQFQHGAVEALPALVNGAAGVVAKRDGVVASVLAFTVSDGRIVEIDILGDPERLAALDLSFLDD